MTDGCTGRGRTAQGYRSASGRILTLLLVIGGVWTVSIDAQERAPGHEDRLPVFGNIFAGGGWFFDEGTITTGPFRGTDTDYRVFRQTRRTWQLGGGVEWRFWRSMGVAAEASVSVVNDQPNGILSLNGVYHLQRNHTSSRVVVPFVTGGYSIVGPERGVNIGAGVNYRLHKKANLRVEARGIRLIREPQFEFVPRPWLLEMRLGLSF